MRAQKRLGPRYVAKAMEDRITCREVQRYGLESLAGFIDAPSDSKGKLRWSHAAAAIDGAATAALTGCGGLSALSLETRGYSQIPMLFRPRSTL